MQNILMMLTLNVDFFIPKVSHAIRCPFSICQAEVDGYIPSEKTMFANFFSQVVLADKLGYGTAWVAENHLSCEVQKTNSGAVIPEFKGEVGLNTDILQFANHIFSKTKQIGVGSAIRNILCNGGPIAHAEALNTFLALQEHSTAANRVLNLGFAAGRFPFSSAPYGIVPRNSFEKRDWSMIKSKIFRQATEIFLRLLKGDIFASADLKKQFLSRPDFKAEADWQITLNAWKSRGQMELSDLPLAPRWNFDRLGLIPRQVSHENLRLIIGSHEAATQEFSNTILPCGVFNLSITPSTEIEQIHQRMQTKYHQNGGKWLRSNVPRTVLVFIDATPGWSDEARREKATIRAKKSMQIYWQAMEGTVDTTRIKNAVKNALVTTPQDIIGQIKSRFHSEDRLMLWFDFFNHHNNDVKKSMTDFWEHVAPHFSSDSIL